MMKRAIVIAMVSAFTALTACQHFIPKAKGLPTLEQNIQTEQYQVELFWKEQSFSFLLKQSPTQQGMNVIALTLTGQVLFELDYDGQQVHILQRYDALKRLPLDFLMRDIWWATMPKARVEQAIQPLNLSLLEQEKQRKIMQNQNIKLSVHYSEQGMEIENPTIAYRMLFTPIHQSFLEE